MLEIADVSKAIAAYESGATSLGQFADWIRAAARRKFAESDEVRDAILEVEALFSELDYGQMSQVEFRKELVKSVRPFVPSELVSVEPYPSRKTNVFAMAAVVVVLVSAKPILRQEGASTVTASSVAGSPAAVVDAVVL